MIKFVNNSEPDITDENLNKMQQDIGTVVSATEPQGDERLRVWIKKGKNLFNKKNVVTGQLEGDGSITYTSQYYTSDFISINPETSYYKTSTNSARFKFYDKDKKPLTSVYNDIENANGATKFISPINAYYVRLTINPSYLDTLQIEQDTSGTSYESYIEPEIYVLNSNGIYEKLVKKVSDTGWLNVALSSGVNPASNGLGGAVGLQYRKIDNHVYVRGSVTFNNTGEGTITLAILPAEFRPKLNHYRFNCLTERNIARVFISNYGGVNVEWIRSLSDGSNITGEISWLGVDMDFFTD